MKKHENHFSEERGALSEQLSYMEKQEPTKQSER
jgi:hypothetical protein